MTTGWSIASVLRDRRTGGPDTALFTSPEISLNAREFDDRCNRVANALTDHGCRPGDRVGFVGRNDISWYELLFGSAKIGAVAVGLNWRLTAPELTEIVADGRLRLIGAGKGFDALALDAASRLDPAPDVVVSQEWDDWRDAREDRDPGHQPRPDDDALQLYTSGTTGAAKGVVLSHRALEASLPAASAWGLHNGSVALVNLPLFHFGGTGWPLWALALGASCVIHPEFDATAAVESFRTGVTTSLAVPQILRLLCDEADRTGGGPFDSLRCLGYGSAPITEELLLRTIRTFDCDLVQTYGMTETCGILTQLGPGDHDPDGPRRHLLRSAGRPVDGVDVRIGGPPDNDKPATASGAVGNVWVRAPWLMSRYFERPDATAATLRSGWLDTGDMGFLDDEGYLHLTDRATDMIISGGENVYPAEVELVLARHPDVADVTALGIPDDRWGESVVAVVVARPGTTPDPEDLRAFTRESLAPYKCPKQITVVDVLPRNHTGKVLRRELRGLFVSPDRLTAQ